MQISPLSRQVPAWPLAVTLPTQSPSRSSPMSDFCLASLANFIEGEVLASDESTPRASIPLVPAQTQRLRLRRVESRNKHLQSFPLARKSSLGFTSAYRSWMTMPVGRSNSRRHWLCEYGPKWPATRSLSSVPRPRQTHRPRGPGRRPSETSITAYVSLYLVL